MNFSNLSRVNIKAINILFLLFPISIIFGNLVININLSLICLMGLFSYGREIFKFKEIKSEFLIILFFLYIIIITIFNTSLDSDKNIIFKSLLYLRYLIFFLILKCMIKNEDIKIQNFLILCLLISIFISFDIIFQELNGKNLFGSASQLRHNSSIFGKELIAGSYVQKFSIFGFMALPFIFSELDIRKKFLIFLMTLIFFTAVLYSGNRVPLIMFATSIIVMSVMKQLRLVFIIGIIFCAFIFSFSILKGDCGKNNLCMHYANFYNHSKNTISSILKFANKEYPELENRKDKKLISKDFNFVVEYNVGEESKKLKEKYELIPISSGHGVVFLTAIDIWNDNIFWGNGIKSLRTKCKDKLHLPNRICTSHPHNYYLEILSDTGIFGMLIFLLSILLLFRSIIINLQKFDRKQKIIILCLVIILAIEFFPLKSSGGFFTSSNSSLIFFLLGLLSGIGKKFQSTN